MRGRRAAVAVILAGGEGRRFWPVSTPEVPKQFLRLFGNRSLLQETVERLKGLIPEDRILVATSENHAATILCHLPALPAENIIIEPMPCNTAAGAALSALHIRRRFGDVPVAVLPSDHWIGDPAGFRTALGRALSHCRTFAGLITFGVRPTRPETGYGYIEVGPEAENGFHRVVRFIEKPGPEEARMLSASGAHLWNTGMFVWRNEVFLSELRTHQPAMARAFSALFPQLGSEEYPRRLRDTFQRLEPVSLDHGVMERSRNLRVLPVDFEWDDVGSWAALARHLEPDRDGNIVLGEGAVVVGCRNCVVYSQGQTVGVVAARDLVVAAAKSGILVAPLERSGDIKGMLDALGAARRPQRKQGPPSPTGAASGGCR